MKFLFTIFFISILCVTNIFPQQENSGFYYEINLENYEDDIFHVTFYPPDLTPADSIYNFVAFAPGVHQVLDFGRYVKSFTAYDINGDEISVENISTNKWKISDPERVDKVDYDIEDTFDADVEEHFIYPMSGTGINNEYVIINSHGVFGYFTNRKSDAVKLDIYYNKDWEIGTALDRDESGTFNADSYFHLADSPILLGNLSKASTMIGDIEVEAYVYSKTEDFAAEEMLELANDVLESAYEFTTFAPVDRYTLLMYFFDPSQAHSNPVFRGGGALEHSYSTTYALAEVKPILGILPGVIAHEFMHILTPLHLRSEIIANFDYSKPTSEDLHLWLYEGVTEWVSNIMLLRSGSISLEEYLNEMSTKISNTEYYGSEYSLARLSAEWSTEEGNDKYGNIYQLGALTAAAMDIELLQLSGGKRGLREVYLELIEKYGKDKPFDNATFFDEIVKLTYPEIESFINNFIKDSKPLNYKKIYGALGINYIESRPSENKSPIFGLGFGQENGLIKITSFSKVHKNFGLEEGDLVLEVFGAKVTLANTDSLIEVKNNMNVGDKYTIKVRRDDEELEFEGELFQRMDYHVLEVDNDATDEQLSLREVWSKNLPLN